MFLFDQYLKIHTRLNIRVTELIAYFTNFIQSVGGCWYIYYVQFLIYTVGVHNFWTAYYLKKCFQKK